MRMRTMPLFSAPSFDLRSPAFHTAFRLGSFRLGLSFLDSTRKVCNLIIFLETISMFAFRVAAVDARQKLVQILCELVLIEEFLEAVVRFDELIYLCLVLLKKVRDLLVLRHRLQ